MIFLGQRMRWHWNYSRLFSNWPQKSNDYAMGSGGHSKFMWKQPGESRINFPAGQKRSDGQINPE